MILAFSLMLAGYGFGAAAAVLAPGGRASRWLVAMGAVVGGVAGLTLAVEVFATGAPFVLEAPTLLSVADGLSFRLDALGAFFLGLVGLVAIPCGLYGVGYYRGVRGPLLAPAPRGHAESVPPHHEPGPLRRQRADLPPDVGGHVAHVVLPRPDRDRGAGHDPRGRMVSGHDARGAGARARRLPAPRGRRADDRLRRSAHRGVRALADDAQRGVPPGAPRLRLQGGDHPAPRVAAPRASGGAEPRLRPDVGGHDQAGRLRSPSRRPGPAGRGARLVGGAPDRPRRPLGGGRRALRPDGERPQAPPRLFERREHRARLHRPRRRLPLSEPPGHPGGLPRVRGGALPRPEPRRIQGAAVPRGRAPSSTPPTPAT